MSTSATITVTCWRVLFSGPSLCPFFSCSYNHHNRYAPICVNHGCRLKGIESLLITAKERSGPMFRALYIAAESHGYSCYAAPEPVECHVFRFLVLFRAILGLGLVHPASASAASSSPVAAIPASNPLGSLTGLTPALKNTLILRPDLMFQARPYFQSYQISQRRGSCRYQRSCVRERKSRYKTLGGRYGRLKRKLI